MEKTTLVLVILVAIHAMCVNASKTFKPAALFVFGDSYVDVGNNNYLKTSPLDQANFSPYGESFFKNATGRLSDGRIIPDFLAKLAGFDSFLMPYLSSERKIDENYMGVSFGSAGAGALSSTLPGFSLGLQKQLQLYADELGNLSQILGIDSAKKIASDAVYISSFGGADIITAFVLNNSIPDAHQFVKLMIEGVSAVIDAIYRQGGKRIVLLNLLDFGCSPGLKIL